MAVHPQTVCAQGIRGRWLGIRLFLSLGGAGGSSQSNVRTPGGPAPQRALVPTLLCCSGGSKTLPSRPCPQLRPQCAEQTRVTKTSPRSACINSFQRLITVQWVYILNGHLSSGLSRGRTGFTIGRGKWREITGKFWEQRLKSGVRTNLDQEDGNGKGKSRVFHSLYLDRPAPLGVIKEASPYATASTLLGTHTTLVSSWVFAQFLLPLSSQYFLSFLHRLECHNHLRGLCSLGSYLLPGRCWVTVTDLIAGIDRRARRPLHLFPNPPFRPPRSIPVY